jgi:hypothetical protein
MKLIRYEVMATCPEWTEWKTMSRTNPEYGGLEYCEKYAEGLVKHGYKTRIVEIYEMTKVIKTLPAEEEKPPTHPTGPNCGWG